MALSTINKSIFSSPFIPKLTTNPTKHHNNFIHIPKVSSTPYTTYLETEFSGHGASFTSLGNSCVVKLRLNNGSSATVMLPSGLVTSYKAPMWHGGLLELLHTNVSEDGDGDGDGVVIRGGVSVEFRCEGSGVGWCPSVWDVWSVGGSLDESVRVELISTNPEDKIEFKHIITLQQDAITSEIMITNSRSSPLQLTGSIIGHLAISTPEAAYALGLDRSSYYVKPPVFSNFSIVPPDVNKNDSGWVQSGFKHFLSGWGRGNRKDGLSDEEGEGEEEDSYKHLTEKLSLIYTSAPRNFTIMDRGKRNSVVVGREGFNELYLFSPGSSHKPYGKYSFLCVGQAALLKPVTIGPESEWRGVQHLHNPNS
ncbi:protein NDH-DEPENDENT CYCLIC ELECTRON FLOW 5-like [Bidens hawaiensis]|uniref:protein NDH-DEPENDENT CYCLIC ELECTRON FLOW 5-like n=1 Tax=Bidens hawaiensis TaxID=980011 RepID=UPI00404A5E62